MPCDLPHEYGINLHLDRYEIAYLEPPVSGLFPLRPPFHPQAVAQQALHSRLPFSPST